MSAQPERRFALPPEPHAPWGIWLVSTALQVVLVVLLVSEPQLDRPPDAFRNLLSTDLEQPSVETTIPYRRVTAARRGTPTPQGLASQIQSAHPGAPRVIHPTAPSSETAPIGVAVTPSRDTARAAPPPSPFRQQFGNGSLWVRPLPITPREIAQQLNGLSRKQIADSVITEVIQGYLDRMAEERAQRGPALPSWTTMIGGKKVGVDQKWIYLGPIKIPTMLLGLLQVGGGNPTAAEYNKRLSAMREDLFEAARRSANYDEFKRAVQELRDETQRKRDFEKNRRTAPDSGHS